MSGFISEPVRTDEHQVATSSHGSPDNFSTQRQHRLSNGPSTNKSVTMNEHDEQDVEMDISAGQKMLSAMSGSLLTSLLGSYLRRWAYQNSLLMYILHSHSFRCRPSTLAISTPEPQQFYPKVLKFSKSAFKYWSNSLLPRSLLGEQYLPILHSGQSLINCDSCDSQSIHFIHIIFGSGLRSR